MAFAAPLLLGTAATATTAATAGAIGFGGAASALGILSGITTGVGVLSKIVGLNQESGQASQAAADAELAGRQEELKGLQQGNEIRRALVRDYGAQLARAGAGGGTNLNQTMAGTNSEAGESDRVNDFNTSFARARYRAQSAYYRKSKPGIFSYLSVAAEGAGGLALRAMER